MKNFQSLEDAKAFSIELNKILKQAGLDSKQYMILEALSHVEGFANWNILSAKFKELANLISEVDQGKAQPVSHIVDVSLPQGKPDIALKINQIKFPESEYFHIDNGGFFFSFAKNVLRIKTSFFGYSENIHYFNINNQELKEIVFMLYQHKNDTNVKVDKKLKESSLTYDEGMLNFKNDYTQVSLSLFLAPIDEMIIYFEKLVLENNIKNEVNEKTPSLDSYHSPFDEMIKKMNQESIDKLPIIDEKTMTAIMKKNSSQNFDLPFISLEQLELHLKKEGKKYNLNQVLNNMAICYRHDFGLLDKPEQEKVKAYIRQIFHAFDLELDETKMKQHLQVDNITWNQLKEEFNYQTQANNNLKNKI